MYTYTYVEIEGIPNYSNMFDLPLNSIASFTPLFAYSSVRISQPAKFYNYVIQIALIMYRSSQNIGKKRTREYTSVRDHMTKFMSHFEQIRHSIRNNGDHLHACLGFRESYANDT